METYGNIVIANLQQRHTYLTDTGTTDAYYVSFLPAITSLDAGLQVVFIASSANTGPCTLTVDGYGPASIVKDVNQDLGSGDILSGQVVNVVYDGTYFQMIATPQQTLSPFSTYLIDGGQITWVANYDYIVSAANYVILGTQYSSPQTPITLNPADPTYDRIDLVAVDNTGSVVVIEGTPSSTPQEPSYEPSSQVPLAFILVAAATTQPACAALTSVYAEDLGSPTEWTVVSSTGTMNVNSTNNPRNGSKDIEGTAVALSSTLTFTPDTPFDSTNITQLDLYIRSKGSWGTTANGHRIQISFQTSGGQVGIPATIAPRGTYGFNSNTTGTYQQVAIPRSVFNIPDGAMITSIVFTIKGSTGTMGFYMDDIAIEQNCIVYPPPVGVSGYSGYSGYSGTGISGYSGYSGVGYSGYSGYSGGGLSAITADNGLTANTATNVQLGGTLLQNTTITQGSYLLNFISNQNTSAITSNNSGAGYSFSGYATIGTAIYGAASGIGGVGISSYSANGIGFQSQSDYGTYGADIRTYSSSINNSVLPVINVEAFNGAGPSQNGFGGRIDYSLMTTNFGTVQTSNQLISKWTDATDATRTSQFSITGVNSGTTNTLMTLDGTGDAVFFGQNIGVSATSGSTGAYFAGTSIGAQLESSAIPLWLISTAPSAANIVQGIAINRNGTGSNGTGINRIITLPNASSASVNGLVEEIVLYDATAGAEFSSFDIKLNKSGSTVSVLKMTGAGLFTLTQGLSNYTDDAAAATGGIGINQLYRNGSVIMIRVS